ncbi:TlpA family protein disulfide reductase [Aureibaculum luteum]|uniref:TlpA family protein disulfide reductase n=1 Tax=Aureibaculum luteum TaxID=1548456 RepID=UPI000E47B09E|nr:TlpA disulfide reductase family protein [Aureibaculum luteum]
MKKVFYAISILIMLSACKSESPAVEYAIISGKVINKGDGLLRLYSGDMSFIDTIQVSDDGVFRDTMRAKFGDFVLYDGKSVTPIHLQQGNDIQINYDSDDFDKTIKISGVGADIGNYFLAKGKKIKSLQGPGNSYFELEEEAYKKKSNEIKAINEALLDSMTSISNDFRTKEKRNLNYEYLSALNNYESYHKHYAKKPEFKVSEGFLTGLEDLDFNNEEDFLSSQAYVSLVTSHYIKKAEKTLEADSTLSRSLVTLKSFSSAPNQTIKNGLLYNHSKFEISYTDDLETFYNTFMEGSTNENNKKEITKTYTKIKSVSKGNVSPQFTNYENHAGGTTSLDDLKGKYVYIDVWATWCGPCLAEIPSLKKVEKTYHDKNIVFVSLSIDKKKDHDKWKKMVTEKELGGIQLIADNDSSSKFVQDYQIMGIPRFILIDPQGNIVNSNAPRPSDKKLITLFDELKI